MSFTPLEMVDIAQHKRQRAAFAQAPSHLQPERTQHRRAVQQPSQCVMGSLPAQLLSAGFKFRGPLLHKLLEMTLLREKTLGSKVQQKHDAEECGHRADGVKTTASRHHGASILNCTVNVCDRTPLVKSCAYTWNL